MGDDENLDAVALGRALTALLDEQAERGPVTLDGDRLAGTLAELSRESAALTRSLLGAPAASG